MKRLLSLFILVVFLFNTGGYYMMYWGLRYQATLELREQLDTGAYADSQTLTIALPLTLPYAVDRNYERVDGEFEYRGEFYKLVKQQLKHDTLFIVCIKDIREKHLVGEMINFTRLANDLPATSKALKIFGNLLKDYAGSHSLALTEHTSGWVATYIYPALSFYPFTRYNSIASPPPWKA